MHPKYLMPLYFLSKVFKRFQTWPSVAPPIFSLTKDSVVFLASSSASPMVFVVLAIASDGFVSRSPIFNEGIVPDSDGVGSITGAVVVDSGSAAGVSLIAMGVVS